MAADDSADRTCLAEYRDRSRWPCLRTWRTTVHGVGDGSSEFDAVIAPAQDGDLEVRILWAGRLVAQVVELSGGTQPGDAYG